MLYNRRQWTKYAVIGVGLLVSFHIYPFIGIPLNLFAFAFFRKCVELNRECSLNKDETPVLTGSINSPLMSNPFVSFRNTND
jgi:hypothetical protein